MAKTKEITAEEYARFRKCKVQNIRKHLKRTGLKNLPDVIKVKYFSRFYVFVVPLELIIPMAT